MTQILHHGWWVLILLLATLACNFPQLAPATPKPTITAPPTATAVPPSPVPPSITPIVGTVAPGQSDLPTAGPGEATVRVKLYFVAINDNGRSGPKVGCGDSLVAVDRDISRSGSPLTDTLTALFAIKTQYYGQSGLYNSLYQSDLRVEGISARSGIFRVNLVGKMQLGGVCDNPRFKEQLRQTILQFPTVQDTEIYVNGSPLDDLLKLS